jgi:hypothetical protein
VFKRSAAAARRQGAPSAVTGPGIEPPVVAEEGLTGDAMTVG